MFTEYPQDCDFPTCLGNSGICPREQGCRQRSKIVSDYAHQSRSSGIDKASMHEQMRRNPPQSPVRILPAEVTAVDKSLNARLNNAIDRLHALAEKIGEARTEVETRADKLVGSQPQAGPEECKGNPESSYTLLALENTISLCESRYNALLAQVQRVI